MKYKLSDINKTIADGGKIVGVIEFNGQVIIATESHVFKSLPDSDEFIQMTFKHMEELK